MVQIIRHHEKLLKYWAKNYTDWCFNPMIGSKVAKDRLAYRFDAETINKLKPLIIEEFKKRGAVKFNPEPPESA